MEIQGSGAHQPNRYEGINDNVNIKMDLPGTDPTEGSANIGMEDGSYPTKAQMGTAAIQLSAGLDKIHKHPADLDSEQVADLGTNVMILVNGLRNPDLPADDPIRSATENLFEALGATELQTANGPVSLTQVLAIGLAQRDASAAVKGCEGTKGNYSDNIKAKFQSFSDEMHTIGSSGNPFAGALSDAYAGINGSIVESAKSYTMNFHHDHPIDEVQSNTKGSELTTIKYDIHQGSKASHTSTELERRRNYRNQAQGDFRPGELMRIMIGDGKSSAFINNNYALEKLTGSDDGSSVSVNDAYVQDVNESVNEVVSHSGSTHTWG
jgi:hypothetical protein